MRAELRAAGYLEWSWASDAQIIGAYAVHTTHVVTLPPTGGTQPSGAPVAYNLTHGTTTTSGALSYAHIGGSGFASPGSLNATAFGGASVNVGLWSANPADTTNFPSPGGYFDLHLSGVASDGSVALSDCNPQGASAMYWWDGSNWQPVANVWNDTTAQCLNVTLDSTTSPSVSQLYGTLFALSGVQPSGATPTPTAAPDDVHASVRTEQQAAVQSFANRTGSELQDAAAAAAVSSATLTDALTQADAADAAASASTDLSALPALQATADAADGDAETAVLKHADNLATLSLIVPKTCHSELWSCAQDGPATSTGQSFHTSITDQIFSELNAISQYDCFNNPNSHYFCMGFLPIGEYVLPAPIRNFCMFSCPDSGGSGGTADSGGTGGNGATKIDPRELRFSQEHISWKFRDDNGVPPLSPNIGDLVDRLLSGYPPESVKPVRVLEKDGYLISLDNRRLAAFRMAGKEIYYQLLSEEEKTLLENHIDDPIGHPHGFDVPPDLGKDFPPGVTVPPGFYGDV